jgi:iron complex outermembrane receptor protein
MQSVLEADPRPRQCLYDDYKGNIFNVAPNVNRKDQRLFKHSSARSSRANERNPQADRDRRPSSQQRRLPCRGDLSTPAAERRVGVVVPNLLAPAALPTPNGTNSRQDCAEPDHADEGDRSRLRSREGTSTPGDFCRHSISAYRNYRTRKSRDGDFPPQAYIGFIQLHDDGPQTGRTFSQEFAWTLPAAQTAGPAPAPTSERQVGAASLPASSDYKFAAR